MSALRPGAGAPPFCFRLAGDPAIGSLSSAILATIDRQDASAPQRVRGAAASLRQYAAAGLGRPASDMAQALDQISVDPGNDRAFDQLETLGVGLDSRMRSVCRTAS
ncbi:hypothetical protein WCD74_01350 [Actinomycetospora sp. OC33-EN08]|uniref:Uncharacterized protein n=1 Tax=Actinomycetospora aurantiaca TaxID=3129233 RepID=A0ABU8MGD5_9PSEU